MMIGKWVAFGFTCVFQVSMAHAVDFSLKSSELKNFPNSLQGRDFFVAPASGVKVKSIQSPLKLAGANCREQIAKVVCLVEPSKEGESVDQRTCLPGSEAYAKPFENLYDQSPVVLQRMYCSLTHIFIEKEFFGTAYAGLLKASDGKVNGAMIGIRKSVIDENLNLNTWASWKEQLSFGGIMDSYTILPDLPRIDSSSQTQANDFLYFVIAHEFGHIFDFANDINKVSSCTTPVDKNEDPECTMHPDSWGALTWITDKKPKAENEFMHRTGLCFYWCKGKYLQRGDVAQVYSDLSNSSFISIYATTQPWDDFADSLAYFVMDKNLNTSYQIDTRQGSTYDIIGRLHSEKFKEKFQYLDQFLKRTDLVYP